MYILPNSIRKKATKIAMFSLLLLQLYPFLNAKSVSAAKLTDGTWGQSASPGTTTIVFTTTTGVASGDKIVLTFPSQASINDSGTDIAITGSTTPTRSNNATNNSITITTDGTVSSSASVTITMTDGLTSYTTSTFAQQSVAINHNDSTDTAVDFGVALITNDNTTDVTANVPLFVTMAVDDVTMDLGTLSASAVNEVDQTYSVNSNNTSGVTIQITADGDLDDASSNTINDVSDGTVTAGSEEYGIRVDNLSGLTASGTFGSQDNAVPQAATNLVTSTGTVSSGTVDINYKASISGSTVAGSYDQVVTVTIATNA